MVAAAWRLDACRVNLLPQLNSFETDEEARRLEEGEDDPSNGVSGERVYKVRAATREINNSANANRSKMSCWLSRIKRFGVHSSFAMLGSSSFFFQFSCGNSSKSDTSKDASGAECAPSTFSSSWRQGKRGRIRLNGQEINQVCQRIPMLCEGGVSTARAVEPARAP